MDRHLWYCFYYSARFFFPKGINADTKPVVIESRKMKESECKALDCTNARFGASLANIGDIDLDGFQGTGFL